MDYGSLITSAIKESIKEIDYSVIKTYANPSADDVDKWNSMGFANYILRMHRKTTGVSLDINKVGLATKIPAIRDRLHERLNRNDNYILKEYIDYYYDFLCVSVKAEFSEEHIYNLSHRKYIGNFCSSYNSGDTTQSSITRHALDREGHRKLYLVDCGEFLNNYGVVWSVNFLIGIHCVSPENACNQVKKIANKYNLDKSQLVLTTNNMSPYPSWISRIDYNSEFKGLNVSVVGQRNKMNEFDYLKGLVCEEKPREQRNKK